jgi:hypothetical protein
MYFILYNFVLPKLNLVQPPNFLKIQFHFMGAAVTLHHNNVRFKVEICEKYLNLVLG